MRLATAQAVLGVLGTQISTGSIATADGALDATFTIVESALETNLIRGRCTDHFDLTKYEVNEPQLRLSFGFVSKDEPIVVTVGGIAVEAYSLQHLLGVLGLQLTCPEGRRVVSVTYSYGFETSVDDDSQLEGLPQGVTQAGISMAATYLMLNPANIAKEKARFLASVSVSGLEIKARQACAQFTRPRGTVIWPTATEVVE